MERLRRSHGLKPHASTTVFRGGWLIAMLAALFVAAGGAERLYAAETDLADAAAVRAAVGPLIEKERKDYRIPGAAFVLVRDGKVIVCDGFGKPDLTKPDAVDPERTLFPVGSLSKVVTAIAVMQLAEGGKLDLNADVNTYLAAGNAPFRVEENFRLPVTAGQLLTHTSGMDDPHIGLGARVAAQAVPLSQYLSAQRPHRVMPPDNLAGYCSEGFSLLGYLVELRSGMSFEAYVERFIFQPLGMAHSSFRQPPPNAVDRAVGYDLSGDGFVLVGEFYVNGVPSAAMTTTAADMGRLIAALLRDAEGGGGPRIISAESVRAMMAVRFRNAPRASGWTFGLHGATEDGERRREHGGLYRGYTSKLVLLPDRHAGFFAAYNRCEARVLAELDALFAPATPPAPPASTQSAPDALDRLAGPYRPTLGARHTVEKLAPLLGPMRVAVEGGQLVLGSGSGAMRFRCTSPGYFVRADGRPGADVVIREDPDGVTHVVFGGDDFVPIPWRLTARGQLAILVVLLLVLVPHCLLRALPGRWQGWLTRAACLTAVLFAVGVGLTIGRMEQIEFLYGLSPRLKWLLVTPWVEVGLTGVIAALVARAWLKPAGSIARRVQATVVLSALAAFLGMVFYWNLAMPFAG